MRDFTSSKWRSGHYVELVQTLRRIKMVIVREFKVALIISYRTPI
jgi:hypothetical protein